MKIVIKNPYPITVCCWALGLFFSLGTPSPGLLIEPLRTILSVAPGDQTQGTIAVTNEKEAPISLKLTFRDHSTFQDWILIDTDPIHLDPSEEKQIVYTIAVPLGASGELQGRLSFREMNPDAEQRTASLSIFTSISIPIYVRIKGTERYEADITDVRPHPFDASRIEVVVDNPGNVHIRPKGSITITADKRQERTINKAGVNRDGAPVYAERERVLTTKLSAPLDPGKYTAHVELTYADNMYHIDRQFPLTIEGKE